MHTYMFTYVCTVHMYVVTYNRHTHGLCVCVCTDIANGAPMYLLLPRYDKNKF